MATSVSTVKSISIAGTSSVISRAIAAATYLWMVSLVSPAELGVITLGLAVYAILGPFRDFGLSPAVIARRDPTPEFLAEVSTIRLAVSGLLSAFGVVLAFVLPQAFDFSELFAIMLLVTGTIFVEFFSFLPNALLQKELRFKQIALADISSTIIMAAVVMAIALIGKEVLALFAGNFAYAAARTVIVNLLRPARPGISRNAFKQRGTISFGGQMVATGIVVYVLFNVNAFVLGKVDVVALGFYGLAFLWATTPADVAAATLARVLLPTYSLLKHDKKLAFDAYLRTMTHLSIIAFGGFLVLIVVSPWLIELFYGSEWSDTVPILLVLLVFGLGRAVSEPAGPLFVVFERVSTILWTSLGSLLVLSAFTYFVAEEYGALGSAWLLAAVYLVYVFVLWSRLLKMFDERPDRIVKAIYRPAAACLACVALLVAGSVVLDGIWALTAIGAALVALYFVLIYALCPADFRLTLAYVKSAARPFQKT